jgi:mannose-6-phosphate isomerase
MSSFEVPSPADLAVHPLAEPLFFEPLYMERVWGGRQMESIFGKRLPPAAAIGESWEVVDRPEAQSVVHSGRLRGLTLNDLWRDYREPVFGPKGAAHTSERFPLLVKILDAQEKLSVQVHPPASLAASMGGEPKTEMWYIVHARDDADLYAGLAAGVTRSEFESALKSGTVESSLHRIPVRAGDAMFLQSGRLHAIGAGNLIFEIQQNSDTTYRVFDWNRVGLDGRPRDLHINQSMASIDFDDVTPPLLQRQGDLVVECEYFRVEEWTLDRPRRASEDGNFAIVSVLEGKAGCGSLDFKPGDFFLVPAALAAEGIQIKPLATPTRVLVTTLP